MMVSWLPSLWSVSFLLLTLTLSAAAVQARRNDSVTTTTTTSVERSSDDGSDGGLGLLKSLWETVSPYFMQNNDTKRVSSLKTRLQVGAGDLLAHYTSSASFVAADMLPLRPKRNVIPMNVMERMERKEREATNTRLKLTRRAVALGVPIVNGVDGVPWSVGIEASRDIRMVLWHGRLIITLVGTEHVKLAAVHQATKQIEFTKVHGNSSCDLHLAPRDRLLLVCVSPTSPQTSKLGGPPPGSSEVYVYLVKEAALGMGPLAVDFVHTVAAFNPTHIQMWTQEGETWLIVTEGVAQAKNSSGVDIQAINYHTYSRLYRWTGLYFDKAGQLPAASPHHAHHFVANRYHFVALASFRNNLGLHNTESHIFRYEGSGHQGRYALFQTLPTRGARHMHTFALPSYSTVPGAHNQREESHAIFLAVANYCQDNGEGGCEPNTMSAIYHYHLGKFMLFQEIPTERAIQWLAIRTKSTVVLALASETEGVVLYQYTGWRFRRTHQPQVRPFSPGVTSLNTIHWAGTILIGVSNNQTNTASQPGLFTLSFTLDTKLQQFYTRTEGLCRSLLQRISQQNVARLRTQVEGGANQVIRGPRTFKSPVTIRGNLEVRGESMVSKVYRRWAGEWFPPVSSEGIAGQISTVHIQAERLEEILENTIPINIPTTWPPGLHFSRLQSRESFNPPIVKNLMTTVVNGFHVPPINQLVDLTTQITMPSSIFRHVVAMGGINARKLLGRSLSSYVTLSGSHTLTGAITFMGRVEAVTVVVASTIDGTMIHKGSILLTSSESQIHTGRLDCAGPLTVDGNLIVNGFNGIDINRLLKNLVLSGSSTNITGHLRISGDLVYGDNLGVTVSPEVDVVNALRTDLTNVQVISGKHVLRSASWDRVVVGGTVNSVAIPGQLFVNEAGRTYTVSAASFTHLMAGSIIITNSLNSISVTRGQLDVLRRERNQVISAKKTFTKINLQHQNKYRYETQTRLRRGSSNSSELCYNIEVLNKSNVFLYLLRSVVAASDLLNVVSDFVPGSVTLSMPGVKFLSGLLQNVSCAFMMTDPKDGFLFYEFYMLNWRDNFNAIELDMDEEDLTALTTNLENFLINATQQLFDHPVEWQDVFSLFKDASSEITDFTEHYEIINSLKILFEGSRSMDKPHNCLSICNNANFEAEYSSQNVLGRNTSYSERVNCSMVTNLVYGVVKRISSYHTLLGQVKDQVSERLLKSLGSAAVEHDLRRLLVFVRQEKGLERGLNAAMQCGMQSKERDDDILQVLNDYEQELRRLEKFSIHDDRVLTRDGTDDQILPEHGQIKNIIARSLPTSVSKAITASPLLHPEEDNDFGSNRKTGQTWEPTEEIESFILELQGYIDDIKGEGDLQTLVSKWNETKLVTMIDNIERVIEENPSLVTPELKLRITKAHKVVDEVNDTVADILINLLNLTQVQSNEKSVEKTNEINNKNVHESTTESVTKDTTDEKTDSGYTTEVLVTSMNTVLVPDENLQEKRSAQGSSLISESFSKDSKPGHTSVHTTEKVKIYTTEEVITDITDQVKMDITEEVKMDTTEEDKIDSVNSTLEVKNEMNSQVLGFMDHSAKESTNEVMGSIGESSTSITFMQSDDKETTFSEVQSSEHLEATIESEVSGSTLESDTTEVSESEFDSGSLPKALGKKFSEMFSNIWSSISWSDSSEQEETNESRVKEVRIFYEQPTQDKKADDSTDLPADYNRPSKFLNTKRSALDSTLLLESSMKDYSTVSDFGTDTAYLNTLSSAGSGVSETVIRVVKTYSITSVSCTDCAFIVPNITSVVVSSTNFAITNSNIVEASDYLPEKTGVKTESVHNKAYRSSVYIITMDKHRDEKDYSDGQNIKDGGSTELKFTVGSDNRMEHDIDEVWARKKRETDSSHIWTKNTPTLPEVIRTSIVVGKHQITKYIVEKCPESSELILGKGATPKIVVGAAPTVMPSSEVTCSITTSVDSDGNEIQELHYTTMITQLQHFTAYVDCTSCIFIYPSVGASEIADIVIGARTASPLENTFTVDKTPCVTTHTRYYSKITPPVYSHSPTPTDEQTPTPSHTLQERRDVKDPLTDPHIVSVPTSIEGRVVYEGTSLSPTKIDQPTDYVVLYGKTYTMLPQPSSSTSVISSPSTQYISVVSPPPNPTCRNIPSRYLKDGSYIPTLMHRLKLAADFLEKIYKTREWELVVGSGEKFILAQQILDISKPANKTILDLYTDTMQTVETLDPKSLKEQGEDMIAVAKLGEKSGETFSSEFVEKIMIMRYMASQAQGKVAEAWQCLNATFFSYSIPFGNYNTRGYDVPPEISTAPINTTPEPRYVGTPPPKPSDLPYGSWVVGLVSGYRLEDLAHGTSPRLPPPHLAIQFITTNSDRVNNVHFEGGVNSDRVCGIDVRRLVHHGVLLTSQTLNTSITFTSPVHINGDVKAHKINGIPASAYLTIHGRHILTLLTTFIGSLTVRGNVKAKTVNQINLSNFINSVVTTDSAHQVLTTPITFHRLAVSSVESESVSVAGVNLDDLVLRNQNAVITGKKRFVSVKVHEGGVRVRHLTLKRINNIDVNALFTHSLSKNSDVVQVLQGEMRLSDLVIMGDLTTSRGITLPHGSNIASTLNLASFKDVVFRDGATTITGSLVLNGAVSIDTLNFKGTFDGVSASRYENGWLLKIASQTFTQNIRITTLTSGPVIVSPGALVQRVDIGSLLMNAVTTDSPATLTSPIMFNSRVFAARVEVQGKVQGLKLSQQAIIIDSSNTVITAAKTFISSVRITGNLTAVGLPSKEDLARICSRISRRDLTFIGSVTFFGKVTADGVHIGQHLLNSDMIDKYWFTDQNVVLPNLFTFEEFFGIHMTVQTINDYNFDDIWANMLRSDCDDFGGIGGGGRQMVTGRFTLRPLFVNRFVTPRINTADLNGRGTSELGHIFTVGGEQVITGHWRLPKVVVQGSVVLSSGIVNGMRVIDWCRLGRPCRITARKTFAQDLDILGNLNVQPGRLVQGVDVSEILRDFITTNDCGNIPGITTFTNIPKITSLRVRGLVDGVNMNNLLTLSGTQVITATHTISHTQSHAVMAPSVTTLDGLFNGLELNLDVISRIFRMNEDLVTVSAPVNFTGRVNFTNGRMEDSQEGQIARLEPALKALPSFSRFIQSFLNLHNLANSSRGVIINTGYEAWGWHSVQRFPDTTLRLLPLSTTCFPDLALLPNRGDARVLAHSNEHRRYIDTGVVLGGRCVVWATGWEAEDQFFVATAHSCSLHSPASGISSTEEIKIWRVKPHLQLTQTIPMQAVRDIQVVVLRGGVCLVISAGNRHDTPVFCDMSGPSISTNFIQYQTLDTGSPIKVSVVQRRDVTLVAVISSDDKEGEALSVWKQDVERNRLVLLTRECVKDAVWVDITSSESDIFLAVLTKAFKGDQEATITIYRLDIGSSTSSHGYEWKGDRLEAPTSTSNLVELQVLKVARAVEVHFSAYLIGLPSDRLYLFVTTLHGELVWFTHRGIHRFWREGSMHNSEKQAASVWRGCDGGVWVAVTSGDPSPETARSSMSTEPSIVLQALYRPPRTHITRISP